MAPHPRRAVLVLRLERHRRRPLVGVDNYLTVFTDPDLLGAIRNAFILIAFFTFIPVGLGLVLSTLIRGIRNKAFAATAQTVLFLPQIIPLAAAGIAWSWMYAQTGAVNQILGWLGLGWITRPWLADYGTALPAVGLIGSWVLTGLCTVLLLTGLGKIDVSLYEAIRLDGAGWWREFFTITLPGLRQEIAVLVTVTVIAALSSFDIIYTSTQGGPAARRSCRVCRSSASDSPRATWAWPRPSASC